MMKRALTLTVVVLAGLGLLAGGWFGWQWWQERQFRIATSRTVPTRVSVEDEVRTIRRRMADLDGTVWGNEIRATEHGETFVRLWDDLRLRPDKLQVLLDFPFQSIELPAATGIRPHALGVAEVLTRDADVKLNRKEFQGWLKKFHAAGYRLAQSEWNHENFKPAGKTPANSEYSVELHLTNAVAPLRLVISLDLHITWNSQTGADGLREPRELAVRNCRMLRREGSPPFTEIRGEAGREPPFPFGNDPLIVADVDRDGLCEILLPEQNALYWNRGGRYERTDLCTFPAFPLDHPRKQVGAATLAELTGDAQPDLLVVGKDIGVRLHRADSSGRFSTPPETVLEANHRLIWPQAVTAGDIDGDGRLDLWIAQLKPAGEFGSMPTPYWDSNDGFMSMLLHNDGEGRFTDITRQSGLEKKRYRRTYSCSFVDLDEDGDLDLLVSSDYAGVDVHLNDGTGQFKDATDGLLDQRHLFGMGHVLGDFNRDGRLDFYVTGMDPVTARRLDNMGLGHPDFPEHNRMRAVMSHGSRLYFGMPDGTFRQNELSDQVARSGWSWGAVALDVANTGFPGLYVANGHISKDTVRSFASRAWRHEIYLGTSVPNLALQRIFEQPDVPNMNALSFEGFQHNRLYVNEAGTNYFNIAFLLDLAFEYDARCAVGDDIDGDGRVDLIVSDLRFDRTRRGEMGNVYVHQNNWPDPGNWVGVRLYDEPGHSPMGARIKVRTAEGTWQNHLISGDSYSSQHANIVHFGLGTVDRVDALEVHWQNGARRTLDRPKINAYHVIRPPGR